MLCHSRNQGYACDNDLGFFFSQSVRHSGASASEASVLDAATRVGAYQVCDSQHRQRALVNAALTYLDVDATFVVERLGNRDREGLQRIAEICSSPMSYKVGGGIPARCVLAMSVCHQVCWGIVHASQCAWASNA